AQLIEADAVVVVGDLGAAGLADGVRAEQGDEHVAVAQRLVDLPVPVAAGAQALGVEPDVVAPGAEVGAEAVGQLLGVTAAVAEEDAGLAAALGTGGGL